MSRRPAAFTQADVARAIRGVAAAGRAPTRVELDLSGKIVVVFDAAPPAAAPDDQAQEEQRWREARMKAQAAAEKARAKTAKSRA